MAERGPLPKRSTERRRRNAVPGETIVQRDEAVKVPKLPHKLHPVAARWYRSLKDSGQSDYFEPSDWQAAVVLAVKLSAHLSSSGFAARLLFVADMVAEDVPEAAEALREMSLNTPSGSASEFSAIWAAMNDLLTTESARRRARMEVERGMPEPVAGPTALDEYRKMVNA